MFRRLSHVLLIVAILATTGTHWFVLQSVAWTTMLAENLRTTRFVEAMQRTFDGDHPCRLCTEIKQGKQAEKKTEAPLSLKKVEFVSDRIVLILQAPRVAGFSFNTEAPPSVLPHKPLLPPPRLVPA